MQENQTDEFQMKRAEELIPKEPTVEQKQVIDEALSIPQPLIKFLQAGIDIYSSDHITVRAAMDLPVVEIYGDFGRFTSHAARKIAEKLLFAADEVENREAPPAPEPITFADLDHSNQDGIALECVTMPDEIKKRNLEPAITLCGYEISLKEAKMIKEFLQKAEEFYSEQT